MGRTGADGVATVMVKAGEWGCMAMSGFGGKGGSKGDGEGPTAMLQKYLGVVKAFAQEEQQDEGSQSKYVVMGGPKFVKVDTTASVEFTALEADRTINVVITDVNGTPLQEHGFIEAELISSGLGSGFDSGGLGQPIDPNMPGMASIQVPAGKYNLRMMTPPGSDYSSGDATEVDVTNGDANATIRRNVKFGMLVLT